MYNIFEISLKIKYLKNGRKFIEMCISPHFEEPLQQLNMGYISDLLQVKFFAPVSLHA